MISSTVRVSSIEGAEVLATVVACIQSGTSHLRVDLMSFKTSRRDLILLVWHPHIWGSRERKIRAAFQFSLSTSKTVLHGLALLALNIILN